MEKFPNLKYNLYWWSNLLYPNKIKKENLSKISYANRGMDLEYLVNEANNYYLINDIAVVYKKPTPIQINKVSYAHGTPEVVKGKFNQKSTLDYVGLYKGKYIDFDAKKTLNKKFLPLENIHHHQLEHIKRVIKHDGLAFLIIEICNKIYLLPGEKIIDFTINNERKSIPLSYIEENGYLINYGYNPVLDYLKIIDEVYLKKERD